MTQLTADALVELDSIYAAEPVPKSSVRWVGDVDEPLLGDSVLLAPYAIANEHVGVHAVLVDRPLADYSSLRTIGDELQNDAVRLHRSDDLSGIVRSWQAGHPVFIATWDGRDPDGRRSTLRAMAEIIQPMFADPTRPPRVIVPGPADWNLLRDAFAWELPLRASFHDSVVEQFALAGHWWIERAKIPGQQLVIVLLNHIRSAWQVPLEPDDQLHLGAVLECFGDRAGDRAQLLDAVRRAEGQPAGPRSMPTFDNEQFLDALGAIGRPPARRPWDNAIELLWGHVAHRRGHLHRAMRLVFADPDLPAAPSVSSTGVRTRPGLIDVEREEWAGHQARRGTVLTAYTAYDLAYRAGGEDHPDTKTARTAANSERNLHLPRHLARTRFSSVDQLTNALDLRKTVEDSFARASARQRGIAAPGIVISAPPPVAGQPTMRGTSWEQIFTFEFTLSAPGRQLGRMREGRQVSFGPDGLGDLRQVIDEGTVTATNYAASTITITYVRKATSTRGPDRIRIPGPRVAAGATIELIMPSRRHASLNKRHDPVGPPPSTHASRPGGIALNLQACNAPIVAMPQDLR